MARFASLAGKDVVEIKSGLEAGEEALKSFQDLAKQLEKEDQSLKDAAKMLLVSGDEASAKDKLLKSQKTKARLLNALQNAAKEKTRVSKLKENLSLVEERVMKIESNMRALSSDRLMQNQNFSPPPSEDPLLEKFRKLEEDNNNN
ncbi:hypothetical protein TL16_g02634 [Triparma laevis f. inornata]|uniref:Uncharacterized protein n=1 Tax=Triparma laevis f. inornata TaxID=1714386 RepID=A0A9W7DW44_9STRA|nr:hypothetical protein TL16_g02634 [Triparma laevis f. inornata]